MVGGGREGSDPPDHVSGAVRGTAGLGSDGDPRGRGTIAVELNATLADLLARLCAELGTEDYPGVLSRALGLFELAQRTRRQGGRLCFVNERGEAAEVVF